MIKKIMKKAIAGVVAFATVVTLAIGSITLTKPVEVMASMDLGEAYKGDYKQLLASSDAVFSGVDFTGLSKAVIHAYCDDLNWGYNNSSWAGNGATWSQVDWGGTSTEAANKLASVGLFDVEVPVALNSDGWFELKMGWWGVGTRPFGVVSIDFYAGSTRICTYSEGELYSEQVAMPTLVVANNPATPIFESTDATIFKGYEFPETTKITGKYICMDYGSGWSTVTMFTNGKEWKEVKAGGDQQTGMNVDLTCPGEFELTGTVQPNNGWFTAGFSYVRADSIYLKQMDFYDGTTLLGTYRNGVFSPAIKVALASTSGTIKVGQTVQIEVTAGSTKAVSYTSADISTATVSDAGLVTGVALGDTTITCTDAFGNSSTYAVSVSNKDVVNFKKTSDTVEVGGTYTVEITSGTPKASTWSSSDTTVATVKNGVVTAKKVGTTTISVKSIDGITTSMELTVNPVAITLSETSLDMFVGEEMSVDVTAGEVASWSSDNENVATVENGEITAVAAGTATITATDSLGRTATVDVTVSAMNSVSAGDASGVTEITISGEASQLPRGVVLTAKAGTQAQIDAVKAAMAKNESKAISKASKITVVDFTLKDKDGNVVSDLGDGVTISCKLPAGYSQKMTVIAVLEDDGTLTVLPTTIKDGVASAVAPHFSTYALIEKVIVETKKVTKTIDITNAKCYENDSNNTIYVLDGESYTTKIAYTGICSLYGIKLEDVISITYSIKVSANDANGGYGTGHDGNGGWGVKYWCAPDNEHAGEADYEVKTPDANGIVKCVVKNDFTSEHTYAKAYGATWYNCSLEKIELTYYAYEEVISSDVSSGDSTNAGIYVAIIGAIVVLGAAYVIRRKVVKEA